MKIAITHFYCLSENDAWIDIIDTNLIANLDLRNFLENTVRNGETSVEMDYDTMQNDLINASHKSFPVVIDWMLTVYEA
jgi:hypothetical protein